MGMHVLLLISRHQAYKSWPNTISTNLLLQEVVKRLKEHWKTNYFLTFAIQTILI